MSYPDIIMPYVENKMSKTMPYYDILLQYPTDFVILMAYFHAK